MADKNKSKLIFGIALIALSFVFILLALYFVGQGAKTPARQAKLQAQLENAISEKAQKELDASDAERTKHKPFNLEDFLKHAESVYGPDELKRKEGVLWIDRKNSSFLVTLGAVNGLQQGSLLEIYEDGSKVGEVSVELPLDIISYAKPVGKTAGDFGKDYYRVSAASPQP